LLSSIERFLKNQKEKILPMGESNACKMVQSLFDEKLKADIE